MANGRAYRTVAWAYELSCQLANVDAYAKIKSADFVEDVNWGARAGISPSDAGNDLRETLIARGLKDSYLSSLTTVDQRVFYTAAVYRVPVSYGWFIRRTRMKTAGHSMRVVAWPKHSKVTVSSTSQASKLGVPFSQPYASKCP